MTLATTRKLLILFFLSLSIGLTAQDSIEAYIIKSKEEYRELRKENFELKYARDSFPRLGTAREGEFPKAHNNSCLIVYFLDNKGVTIRGKKLPLRDSIFVQSIAMDTLDTLTLNHYRKKKTSYSTARFEDIGVKISADTPIRLPISDVNKSELAAFYATYSFFPGKDSAETVDFWHGAYEEDETYSKYDYAHRMVRELRDPMYLSLLPVFLNFSPPYSDQQKSRLYIMEGNFSMPFTIMQGRNDQEKNRLRSLTVDPEFIWRITTKNSAPLLPLNTKVGLVYHWTKLVGDANRSDYSLRDEFKKNRNTTLKTNTYGIHIRHYSNGQEDSAAFYRNAMRIPNFESGNFSLNYLKFSYSRNQINGYHRQMSFGGSLQWNTPIGFEFEQRRNYGDFQLAGMWMLKLAPSKRRSFFAFNNHKVGERNFIKVPSLLQKSFRFDLVTFFNVFSSKYESGNADRPPVAAYEGYSGNPFRHMGLRFRMYDEPVHNRSVGWFYQLYYGRDYLNIQYNTVSLSFMFGLTFKFQKDSLEPAYLNELLGETYEMYRDNSLQTESMFQRVFKRKN